MSVTRVVDLDKIHFAPPKKVAVNNRSTYWFQKITYGNGESPLLLQSPKYRRASVVKSQFDNTKKFILACDLFPNLKEIDLLASQSYDLNVLCGPGETFNRAKESYYRYINTDNIFVKMASDFHAFDVNKKPYTGDFGYGSYKVIVQVTGVYIGPHGSSEEKASLQLRVKQVMHDPTPTEEPLFIDSDNDEDEEQGPTGGNGSISKSCLLTRRKRALHTFNIPITEERTHLDWINECDDADHLIEVYDRNDYGTQQPTEEDQEYHDAMMSLLRKRINTLKGVLTR